MLSVSSVWSSQRSGSRIFYSLHHLEELAAKQLFDRYEEVTGIRVDWVRLSGGEAEARMEAEKMNPQASIWVGGVGLNHISAKLKGLTTPYFSRAAANTPEQYKDPEGYWIGLYLGPLAFVTNVDRARELGIEPPKGWFDILDSKYTNLVRVAIPAHPERPTTSHLHDIALRRREDSPTLLKKLDGVSICSRVPVGRRQERCHRRDPTGDRLRHVMVKSRPKAPML